MRIIGNDPSTPRQAQIVASGTLSTGDAVVVNADGTVSVAEGSDKVVGSGVVFETDYTNQISAAYDANAQKVVIAYRDNSLNYGTAVVGTVSGTSISFGTPVVFESATTTAVSTVYDGNAQKIVITYQDGGNSSYGTAIVGTVSGTSISFGSPTVFESATTFPISAAYDSNAQKIVVAYRDYGNSFYGTAIVGTVSGTSISFGTSTVFAAANIPLVSICYDSNVQKVVVAYQDEGNSYYGTAIVGTVSGTSISFGSPTVFENGSSSWIASTYDANAQKVVVAYSDNDNSQYGTAVVGTVSGTSISFGSPVVFSDTGTANSISVSFDSSANAVVIAYRDYGNSQYGTFITGTVSGTSITFESATVFESSATHTTSLVYDPTEQKTIIGYGNADDGISLAVQLAFTNLTADNYIGTAATGAPSGTGAKINLKGAVDENQSGLTAGQSYYVQTDGTLGTTPADPSVFAGTAVAATKLIVKG